MKKIVLALSTAASFALLTGCAGTTATPVNGFLFTDAKGPLMTTTNATSTKEGKATCTSILGWIGQGDCSIEAAAKAGGITEISTVDTEVTNLIGIYATRTTVVRGR